METGSRLSQQNQTFKNVKQKSFRSTSGINILSNSDLLPCNVSNEYTYMLYKTTIVLVAGKDLFNMKCEDKYEDCESYQSMCSPPVEDWVYVNCMLSCGFCSK